MAVGFDAKMTAGDGDGGRCDNTDNGTSASSDGMTVGASATLLVAVICLQNGTADVTDLAMTWDGVSMTERASVTSSSGGTRDRAAIFTLVNPAVGNKTLAASWTTTSDAYMSCISFTGTDTITGVNAADNTTATNTADIVVPTDSSGATVACYCVNGDDPSVTQTEIFSEAPLDPGGAASYAIGGTTSNTHSFTSAGSIKALAGVHVIAPAAPGVSHLGSLLQMLR